VSSADHLARAAAVLLLEGRAPDVATALRRVMEKYRGAGLTAPTHARVRQHLEAMRMQQLGAEQYAAREAARSHVADQLLSTVDVIVGGDPVYLVGRTAEGATDSEGTVHLRVYTDLASRVIADRLRDLGYSDPVLRGVRSRLGPIEELRFVEEEWPVVIRVCPPVMEREACRDLFTGRRITVMRWQA